MSRDIEAIAARVAALCAPFASEAVKLSAELLDVIEQAAAVLAPVADDDSPAGIAAGVAFQLLADAAASAKPPPAVPA